MGGSSLERGGPRDGDLAVLRAGSARGPDCADDLAVDHERDPAIGGDHARKGQVAQSQSTSRDVILKRLGRAPEQRR